MQAFAARLKPSKLRADKELHAQLADHILPRLEETAAARRRAEEKAALWEALPKKRSSRWAPGLAGGWLGCLAGLPGLGQCWQGWCADGWLPGGAASAGTGGRCL
jgi:hypothetical protein